MEGGPRFGGGADWRIPPVESPEQIRRNEIGEVVRGLQHTAESDLAREILAKVDEKLRLKDDIALIKLHADDITIRQPLKRLGMFLVKETTTRINYEDPQTGFRIQPGDVVLDLHLPPVRPEDRTLTNVTRSLQMVAEYMDAHNIDPKYIIGVTFDKLARVSSRQGFTVIEAKVPDDIKAGVERVYHKLTEPGKRGEPMGPVMVCYQIKEDFMSRYLKKKPIYKKPK